MEKSRPIAVPPAFTRVQDVIDGLADLEKAMSAARDRRGPYVTTYLVNTRCVQASLGRGVFHNTPMVAHCVVVFANAYRDALAGYEQGERQAVPEAWRQAFDACRDGKASILQNLLLGINAHINFDLPHTVLQAGLDTHCHRCYGDHARINDVLRHASPLVRRRIAAVYASRLHVANWLFGRAIDAAVAVALARARRQAWRLAQTLASAPSAAARMHVAQAINDRAVLAGRLILAHHHQPARCIAALDIDAA
jgi:hypothetical protein